MSTVLDRDLLAVARTGDPDAFARLVDPHRAVLHARCRRILGSSHDAEDAVQETLLRAWRALDGFEGRCTVRAWLLRIATNCALDALQRRAVAAELARAVAHEAGHRPAHEAGDPGAQAERREGVALAFAAVHEHLPPRQRAVLVLREALDLSAAEVAASLQTTTASVNSALQRARATVAARGPDRLTASPRQA